MATILCPSPQQFNCLVRGCYENSVPRTTTCRLQALISGNGGTVLRNCCSPQGKAGAAVTARFPSMLASGEANRNSSLLAGGFQSSKRKTEREGRSSVRVFAKKKDKGKDDDEGGTSLKSHKAKKDKDGNGVGISTLQGADVSEGKSIDHGEHASHGSANGKALHGPNGGDHKANEASEGDGALPHSGPDLEEIASEKHYPDDATAHASAPHHPEHKREYHYGKELQRLQLELVKLQEWIHTKKLRVVVIFEGRDAAGKGGLIKTITEPLNPRVCSVVALGTPSDREKTQWYFQRYVARLPAAGEMVLFDRSWYNRAGVEKVMGFCTNEEYKEFLRSCPEFERMLVRSGIKVIKYWASVSPEEQEKRFLERLHRPEKRWKLSPMDLESRARWADYSYAKDVMFNACDISQAPWYVIPADDKKAARLNCISHLLSLFDYEDLIVPNDVEIPPLQKLPYKRSTISDQTFVPQLYG